MALTDIATLGLELDSSKLRAGKRDLDSVTASGNKAADALDNAGKKGSKGLNSVEGAARAAKAALASLGVGLAIRQVIAINDAYAQVEGRLRLVTGSTEELADIQERLFGVAQRTGVAYEETANLYAKVAKNADDLGLSQQQLLDFTEITNQAIQVSGASAIEAAGGVRQLGQALASGALRGDEFNSLAENMPRLRDAIADGLGVSIGELRKFAAEGKLTAEVVTRALLSQSEVIEREFQALPVTVGRAMTELENEVKRAIAGADTGPLVDGLREMTRMMADPATQKGLQNFAGGMIGVATALAKVTSLIGNVTNFVAEEVAARVNGASLEDVVRVGEELDRVQKRLSFERQKTVLIGKEAHQQTIASLEAEERALQGKYATAQQLAADRAKEMANAGKKAAEAAAAVGAASAGAAGGVKALTEAEQKAIDKLRERIGIEQRVFALMQDGMDESAARYQAELEAATGLNKELIVSEKKVGDLAEAYALLEKATPSATAYKELTESIEKLSTVADAGDIARYADAWLQTIAPLDDATSAVRQYEQNIGLLELALTDGIITQEQFEAAATRMRDALRGDSIGDVAKDAIEPFQDLRDVIVGMGTDWGRSAEAMLQGLENISKGSKTAVRGYAQLAQGAARFFDEGTSGYKLLESASQAFYAFELTMRAADLAAKLTTDQAKIASAGGVAVAEGAANVAGSGVGLPFPANIAAMAATIAFLASMGIFTGGGGGGGGGGALDVAPPRGGGLRTSGTVLGDPKAASESITNSLDRVAGLLDTGLDINRQMLAALRNIEAALGAASATVAQVARSIGVQSATITGTPGNISTDFNTAISPLFDALFGDEFNAITDQFTAGPASRLENAIQAVFDNMGAALGEAVESLGGDAQQAINAFVALDLGQIVIREGEDIDEAIEALFSAVGDSAFAIIADQLGINLQAFQQIGEGAAETLIRLAAEMDILRDASETLGIALRGAPQEIVAAADALAQAAGGVDEFASNVAEFFDLVLSDTEKLARSQELLANALEPFGVAVPQTTEELRALVQSLNLTTSEGQALFTILTELSPALGELYDSMQEITDAAYEVTTALGITDGLDELRVILLSLGFTLDQVQEAALGGTEGLRALFATLSQEGFAALQPVIGDILSLVPDSARDRNSGAEAAARERQRAADEAARRAEQIATERAGLERQILQLQGDELALRQQQLAALDPSNRALQEQIFSLQDAAQAEQELAAERDRIATERAGLETQLYQLLGDTDTLRARELAQLDESNRALQERIWSLQDEQEAVAQAANLSDALAQARDRERDAARQQLSEMRQQRLGLENDLLNLIGATAELRRRERAELYAGNRGLFDQINALKDLKAANDEAVDGLSSLRDSVLAAANDAVAAPLSAVRAQFDALAERALGGDRSALSGLADAGAQLRDASLAQASTREEYLRDLARLSNVAGDAQSLAEREFDEQVKQTLLLAGIKGTLEDLRGVSTIPGFADGGSFGGGLALVGEQGPELVSMGPARIFNAGDTSRMLNTERLERRIDALLQEVAQLRSDQKASQYVIAKNTGKTADNTKLSADLHDDWDANGLPPERAAA